MYIDLGVFRTRFLSTTFYSPAVEGVPKAWSTIDESAAIQTDFGLSWAFAR